MDKDGAMILAFALEAQCFSIKELAHRAQAELDMVQSTINKYKDFFVALPWEGVSAPEGADQRLFRKSGGYASSG